MIPSNSFVMVVSKYIPWYEAGDTLSLPPPLYTGWRRASVHSTGYVFVSQMIEM